MKVIMKAYLYSLCISLYIPHGSDERSVLKNIMKLLIIFISHMVQMKGSVSSKSKTALRYFISHMVQMKAGGGGGLLLPGLSPLYPTWFR